MGGAEDLRLVQRTRPASQWHHAPELQSACREVSPRQRMVQSSLRGQSRRHESSNIDYRAFHSAECDGPSDPGSDLAGAADCPHRWEAFSAPLGAWILLPPRDQCKLQLRFQKYIPGGTQQSFRSCSIVGL